MAEKHAKKRKALGRGLSALIPEAAGLGPAGGASQSPREIDIDRLRPNPGQPRRAMDEAGLEELTRSVRAHGVIQPIVVTRRADDPGFEIVAGERRWRAAQRAGLLRVPVVVRDVEGTGRRLELALIENIQRENLNPIEEAAAYRRLTDEFGLTQQAVAASVGKDRATVANYQRLLGLPSEVQAEVAGGQLSMGHARALLGLPDAKAQRAVAREVHDRGLSVRATEARVQRVVAPPPPAAAADPPPPDPNVRDAEGKLRRALGTQVRIVQRGARGRIEIAFTSQDELQRLYEQLTRA